MHDSARLLVPGSLFLMVMKPVLRLQIEPRAASVPAEARPEFSSEGRVFINLRDPGVEGGCQPRGRARRMRLQLGQTSSRLVLGSPDT